MEYRRNENIRSVKGSVIGLKVYKKVVKKEENVEKKEIYVRIDVNQTVVYTTNKQKLISIFQDAQLIEANTQRVYLGIQDKKMSVLGISSHLEDILSRKCEEFILLEVPDELESNTVASVLFEEMQNNKLKVTYFGEVTLSIDEAQLKQIKLFIDERMWLLSRFGYPFLLNGAPKKEKLGKVQHRWKKAISEIEFTVDAFDSQATVIWQKRNELLIKKGAILKQEVPLKKDGTVGLDGRFGKTLREEQQLGGNQFVTKEDIILKSVNEVGLFLYYGGTNSWLVLKDQEGKSLDEWTRVD